MLDAEECVKVLDFGLAKYTRPLRGGEDDDADAESVHTVPGMLMETLDINLWDVNTDVPPTHYTLTINTPLPISPGHTFDGVLRSDSGHK
jgi:hypothetical protein